MEVDSTCKFTCTYHPLIAPYTHETALVGLVAPHAKLVNYTKTKQMGELIHSYLDQNQVTEDGIRIQNWLNPRKKRCVLLQSKD